MSCACSPRKLLGEPAEILLGEPTNREAVITSNITTEWKTYRQLLVNKPENNMRSQLFPNLYKIL